MLCRLCLHEVVDYLNIFNENSAKDEFAIAKIIVKYLYMEFFRDDEISNVICHSCWQQLTNFHKFWLLITQKQKTLQRELPIITRSKQCSAGTIAEVTIVENNEQDTATSEIVAEVDDISNVNAYLREQLTDESLFAEVNEFGGADLEHAKQSNNYAKAAPSNRKLPTRPTKRKILMRKVKEQVTSVSHIISGEDILPNESQQQNVDNARVATIRELDAYIAQQGPLNCCLCAQPLHDFSVLKKHFRKEHKCVGYVLCCNHRFRKRTLYVDHLKLHENPHLFKCLQCSKVLASRSCYYNHMSMVHPPEEQLTFKCKFCALKFAKQYILDYHLRKHRGADHLCVECNKSYRTLYELKTHQKRVHQYSSVVICDVCGKHFKSKQNLQLHNSSIHQQVQLPEAQCQICQKWLKDERSLFKHMYKHRDEESGKEFVCKICGARKLTRQSLTSHVRYHHSNKKYNCTLCEKVFKRRLALEEHKATHTGQDLYSCKFCAQTFKSYANMHSHMRKVHPNEWVRKYTQPTKTMFTNDIS